MLGVTIDVAKSRFFDRPAVQNAYNKAERKVHAKIGANTMTTARRSIRPISKSAQRKIKAKLDEARKAKGTRRAALLQEVRVMQAKVHSQPGNPPKTATKKLPKSIFFAADDDGGVVIGPVLFPKSTGAQAVLEHGGQADIGGREVSMKQRPYMGPARDKVLPTLTKLWENAIQP
jgi:hypothetical protein